MLTICKSFLPIGGGSRAFDKNCPTDPRRSNLMESANSCRGVLNISGVMYSSILSYLDIVNRIVCRSEPAPLARDDRTLPIGQNNVALV